MADFDELRRQVKALEGQPERPVAMTRGELHALVACALQLLEENDSLKAENPQPRG